MSNFKIGDRVSVVPGKEHDKATKEATGTIKQIGTAALAVKFDGMDKIHKWYTAAELEPADDEKQESHMREAVNYLVSGKGGTHLPVSNSSGEPDHRLMGAAWAALHGGYRGNKYSGPNKSAAIAKLKAMYDSAKMAMPSESFFVPDPKDSLMFEVDGTTMKDDSFSAICQRIQCALDCAIKNGEDMDLDGDNDAGMSWACVMDIFPTTVVYSMEGDLFQCEYHDDGEMVTLGTPVEVEQSYTVVPADSAQDSEDDMESHRALVGNVVQLEEAAYDSAKGELTMTVIKPGFSKNTTEGRQRFYPASTLKRDFKVFEGAKQFADHQTDRELRERPEGSVNNWVAQIHKVWAEADGTVKATSQVIDPAFKAKLAALAEKGMLNQMGVSVRIGAKYSKAEIEGQEAVNIDSILSNRSVDFVTYPGAGGQVEVLESAVDSANDLELANEAQLRERRPDLVKLIEARNSSKSNGQEGQKAMKTLEEKLQESEKALTAANKRAEVAETANKTLQETLDANPNQVAVRTANKRADVAEARANANEAQVATLTTQLEEADATNKKNAAAAELVKLLGESKLPDVARQRIAARFAEATSNQGMKEAIATEVGYIKSVGGSAKVTNLGDRHNALEVSEADRNKRRIEIMKRSGMTQEQAETAAAGR